jgi:hypothetical protein
MNGYAKVTMVLAGFAALNAYDFYIYGAPGFRT